MTHGEDFVIQFNSLITSINPQQFRLSMQLLVATDCHTLSIFWEIKTEIKSSMKYNCVVEEVFFSISIWCSIYDQTFTLQYEN